MQGFLQLYITITIIQKKPLCRYGYLVEKDLILSTIYTIILLYLYKENLRDIAIFAVYMRNHIENYKPISGKAVMLIPR